MKLMQQAQEMRRKMKEVQEALGEKRVEARAGGGAVVVVANGHGEVLEIKIKPEVVDASDVEMLQDLVLSGVRQAIEAGKKLAADEMGGLAAGLGLPPGLGF
jgi:nucleoid-associated protein EbfC